MKPPMPPYQIYMRQLAEQKNCLGWYIHTRSLHVFLPIEKETYWVQDIRASLYLTKIITYRLEPLIGKLNHSAHIITPAR